MDESRTSEEINIALNLPNSIKDNNLIERDISSLDRIIEKYFLQKTRNISDEKEVINFLFEYINLNGMDSSVLFRHLSKSSERDKVIERLYENYKNKFDFNLVNSSLFESAYENIHLKKTIRFLKIFCILLLMTTIFVIFKIIKQKSIIVEYEKINMKLNEFQQSNNIKIMEDAKIKLKLEEEIKNKNKSAEELKENLLNKSKEIEIIKNQKEHETKEKEKILKIIFQPSEYFIVSQNGLKFCIDSNGEYTFVSEFHGGPSQKWRLKDKTISSVRSNLVRLTESDRINIQFSLFELM